jgi:hypothetical protein
MQRGRDFAVNSPIAVQMLVARERDQPRTRISTKGIWLRRPVQIPTRSGKSTEMVLGGLVVVE